MFVTAYLVYRLDVLSIAVILGIPMQLLRLNRSNAIV